MATGTCEFCGKPLGTLQCTCAEMRKKIDLAVSVFDNLEAHDKVKAPSWYTKGGIQTIDYIAVKELNFNRGNVIKYTTRAGHKPGDYDKEIEDLKKARVYLTHEIERLEKLLTMS